MSEQLLMVLIVLGGAGLYLAGCAIWPYGRCAGAHCEGGKIRRPDGRAWRTCRRCSGTGARRKLGARLLGRN